jgi:hypothetical protein
MPPLPPGILNDDIRVPPPDDAVRYGAGRIEAYARHRSSGVAAVLAPPPSFLRVVAMTQAKQVIVVIPCHLADVPRMGGEAIHPRQTGVLPRVGPIPSQVAAAAAAAAAAAVGVEVDHLR